MSVGASRAPMPSASQRRHNATRLGGAFHFHVMFGPASLKDYETGVMMSLMDAQMVQRQLGRLPVHGLPSVDDRSVLREIISF